MKKNAKNPVEDYIDEEINKVDDEYEVDYEVDPNSPDSEPAAYQGAPEEEKYEDDHIPEENPEDEVDPVDDPEEEVVEEHYKTSRRNRENLRLRNVLRERAQAAEKAMQLEQEVSRLQQIVNISNETNQIYQENLAKRNKEIAQKEYQEALDSGDVQSQIKSQAALARAEYDLMKSEETKIRQQYENYQRQQEYYNQQQAQQNQPAQRQVSENDMRAQQWMNQNTWFLQNSPDFDPDLRRDTDAYINRLEEHLHQIGKPHLIGSHEYLQYVDKFVDKRLEQLEGYDNQSTRRQIPMKNSRSSVSPVRGGGRSSQAKRRGEPSLHPIQEKFMKSMGLKEEHMRRAIKEDRAHQDMLRRGY